MELNVVRRSLGLVALVTLLVIATGCSTPIGDLKANPGKYQGQTVTIKGTVTASAKVLFVSGFTVEDGSGTILVVPKGAVPREGEKVKVKGQVEQLFAVGSSATVVFKEK